MRTSPSISIMPLRQRTKTLIGCPNFVTGVVHIFAVSSSSYTPSLRVPAESKTPFALPDPKCQMSESKWNLPVFCSIWAIIVGTKWGALLLMNRAFSASGTVLRESNISNVFLSHLCTGVKSVTTFFSFFSFGEVQEKSTDAAITATRIKANFLIFIRHKI